LFLDLGRFQIFSRRAHGIADDPESETREGVALKLADCLNVQANLPFIVVFL
jgi:hypothetical protein